MKQNKLVSVIIPCYNHGAYIDEALTSVFSQTYRNIEVVIVDDGSTDPATVVKIKTLKHERLRVYTIKNQGVSTARNYAISASNGEYILPLDSDDKIAPTYVEKAVAIANGQGPMAVVDREAAVFGEHNMNWKLPPFSKERILRENMIFCTALFSKTLFQKIGGFKPNMRLGWEDWDFWLSAVEHGASFHRLPEILFYYRMVKHSRNASLDLQRMKSMYVQLFQNHRKLFVENIHVILEDYVQLREKDRIARNRFSAKIMRKFRKLFWNADAD